MRSGKQAGGEASERDLGWPVSRSPSRRMIALAAPTLINLRALAVVVSGYAKRHPGEPVVPVIRERASKLLADVRRILSRDAGVSLYRLGEAPAWAELEAVLEANVATLTAFCETNKPITPEMAKMRRIVGDRLAYLERESSRVAIRGGPHVLEEMRRQAAEDRQKGFEEGDTR
jgi:hypothetical protein